MLHQIHAAMGRAAALRKIKHSVAAAPQRLVHKDTHIKRELMNDVSTHLLSTCSSADKLTLCAAGTSIGAAQLHHSDFR